MKRAVAAASGEPGGEGGMSRLGTGGRVRSRRRDWVSVEEGGGRRGGGVDVRDVVWELELEVGVDSVGRDGPRRGPCVVDSGCGDGLLFSAAFLAGVAGHDIVSIGRNLSLSN